MIRFFGVIIQMIRKKKFGDSTKIESKIHSFRRKNGYCRDFIELRHISNFQRKIDTSRTLRDSTNISKSEGVSQLRDILMISWRSEQYPIFKKNF